MPTHTTYILQAMLLASLCIVGPTSMVGQEADSIQITVLRQEKKPAPIALKILVNHQKMAELHRNCGHVTFALQRVQNSALIGDSLGNELFVDLRNKEHIYLLSLRKRKRNTLMEVEPKRAQSLMAKIDRRRVHQG